MPRFSTLHFPFFIPIRRLVEAGVWLLIAAIAVHTWLIAGLLAPVVVCGESMLPTLASGQHLIVDRTAFQLADPGRGQLVVLCCPENASTYCVKRIVGLPGETVEIRDGQLWIDGKAFSSSEREPYSFAPIGQPAQYRLAAGEYFLLGDNLAESLDSRTWQPPDVPLKLFIGKLLYPRR